METQSTFANNFWGKEDVGYERLIQHMHHAKHTCEELQAFYKERSAIEQEYSRKLSALSKKGLGTHETGSMRASLDTVRASTEAMARAHELTAKQLADQLLQPLLAFSDSHRERRKTVEDTMARLTKAKTQQNANAEKSRARYEAECKKISGYQAQQNLLMGHDLDRNNQKLERSRFAVEGMQRQYQDALRALAQTIEGWNGEWKVSCDRLQQLEDERLNFFKSSLWAYANAVSTVCVSDDEGCESVRVALEKCDPNKDLEHFVREFGTGSNIQDPPEFTNFLGGFSRDDQSGRYRVANFSSAPANASHPLNDVPNLMASPESQFPSDSASATTPATSVSSANTSPILTESTAAAASKRRSWAMPFKRQSSPDLTQYRPREQPREQQSFDFGTAPILSDTKSQPQVPEKMNMTTVPPGSRDDPLLAALEKLKPAKSRQRPMSMPGYHTSVEAPAPYANGHSTGPSFAGSSGSTEMPRSRSPTRKQVSSGAPASMPVSVQSQMPHMQYLPPQQAQTQRNQPSQQQMPRSKSAPNGWSHPGGYSDASGPMYQQQPYGAVQQFPQSRGQPVTAQMQPQVSRQSQRLPTRASNGASVIRHSRAQYDYRAAIPEEVSFRKGDILLVLSQQEDGWWEVEVLGKRRFGLAPSNFLADVRP